MGKYYLTFIHLNDQLVEPIVPYATLGTPVEAPNAIKERKSQETAIALTPIVNQRVVLLRTRTGIIYRNLQ